MEPLWHGRFGQGMDDSTLRFTSSLDVDSRLAFYDVMGSLAHVRMLKARSIIPPEDADLITEGLKDILGKVREGAFEFDPSLEDVHTCVEYALTEAVGPAGGRLHTARSRNDQVATDFRMYLRDAALDAAEAADALVMALAKVAEDAGDAVMPGFTHMQHAQPVTLAHHMLAHAFRLSRDADRFMDAFRRMDKCPLGSAALAGTTYPIDRRMTAEALGFREPTENSMDGVSDRDFATELAYCAAQMAVHLSSLSEELVLWSSQEFGFAEMDDRHTTGSSIMPQKKNPDIAELVRGRTGGSVGALVSMLVMTKGLPLTYNRDLQEDKRPVMVSLESVSSCARILAEALPATRFDIFRMQEATEEGFINATDLADYLATKGLPFREAHAAVGAAVRYCIERNKALEDLSLEELRGFSDRVEADVFQVLPVSRCVERRSSYGGTASSSTDVQLAQVAEQVMLRDEAVRQERLLIENCWKALLERSPVREHQPERVPALDPGEPDPLELDHVALLRGDGPLRQAFERLAVRHQELRAQGVGGDPLDGLHALPQHPDVAPGVFRRQAVVQVAEVFEAHPPGFRELPGVLGRDEDRLGPLQAVAPAAPLREVRMQRGAALDHVDAVDVVADRVGHQEVPVRLRVDDLAVHAEQAVPREPDVYGLHPGLHPVAADGLRADAAPRQRPDGAGADVVPSGVLAAGYRLADQRGLEHRVRDVHQAVVVVDGLPPAHVVEDVLLPERVVEVVLPADDVGHPHLVVVHRDGEVHHGVRGVFRAGPRVGVLHYVQRDEVPQRRVRVVQVSLDHDDRLSFGVVAGEEPVEALHLLLDREVPARARRPLLLEAAPLVRVAGAHVRVPVFDEPPGAVVVEREPVGLDEGPGAPHSEPVQVLGDHVVRVGVYLSRVGVLEPQEQVPAVALHVLVVQHRHPGVPYVERPGGPRRYAHHDLPVHPVEVAQLVGADLLLLDEERGVHLLQGPPLGLRTHGVDLGHDGLDQRGDLGSPGAEFGEPP